MRSRCTCKEAMLPNLGSLGTVGRGPLPLGSLAQLSEGLRHLQHDVRRDRALEDDLSSHYSGLSEEERSEASTLLAAAERLFADEDGTGALAKAQEALTLLQDDKVGVIEAQKLVISAQRLQGDMAAALETAQTCLQSCEEQGDARGVVGMLTSLVELALSRGHAEEALDLLSKTEAKSSELQDPKLSCDVSLTACNVHMALDNPGDAAAAAEEALQGFQELGDEQGEAKAVLAKAQARFAEGYCREGEQLCDAALPLARKVGSERLQVSIMLTLSSALIDGSASRARQLASESLQLCKTSGFARGESLSLYHLVLANVELGSPHEASQLAAAAVQRFAGKGQERYLAWAQDALSQAHLLSHSRREALKAAWASMELLQGVGDKRAHARSLLLVAMLHLINGQDEWAAQAAQEANRISVELEDKKGEGLAGYVQIFVCILRDDTSAAVAAAEEVQQIFQETGDKRWLAGAALTLCQVYRAAGVPKAALTAAMRAQYRFEDAGDRKGSCVALLEAAELSIEAGAPQKALKFSTKARRVAEEIGYNRGMAVALHVAASAEMSQGNIPEGIRFGRHARDSYREVVDRRGEAMTYVVLADASLAELAKRAERMQKYELEDWDYSQGLGLNQEFQYPEGVASPARPLGAMPEPDIRDLRNDAYTKDFQLQEAAAKAAATATREAADFCKQVGHAARDVFAGALHSLARFQLMTGNTKEAWDSVQRALIISRELGDKFREAVGLTLSAEIKVALNDPREAAGLVHQGLSLFKKAEDTIGERYAKDVTRYVAGEEPMSAAEPEGPGLVVPPVPESFSVSPAEAPKAEEGFSIDLMLERVGELARQSVGLDDDISLDNPLMDIGMDSLSSVQFRNDLVKDVGLTLPTTLTFDYPSVRAIAEHVIEVSRPAEIENSPQEQADVEEIQGADDASAAQPGSAGKKKAKRAGAVFEQDTRVGRPHIVGSWNGWMAEEMRPGMSGGVYTHVLRLGSNRWESFQILCDANWERCLYPSSKDASPAEPHTICGPDEFGHGYNWTVGLKDDDGREGMCFEVQLLVDDTECAKRITWQQVSASDPRAVELQKKAALAAHANKPFIAGSWNNWGAEPMGSDSDGSGYSFNLVVGPAGSESFQVLISGEWKRCVHPKVRDSCPCNPFAANTLEGPDENGNGRNWRLGAHPLDMAQPGDRYRVSLRFSGSGEPSVVDWAPVN